MTQCGLSIPYFISRSANLNTSDAFVEIRVAEVRTHRQEESLTCENCHSMDSQNPFPPSQKKAETAENGFEEGMLFNSRRMPILTPFSELQYENPNLISVSGL